MSVAAPLHGQHLIGLERRRAGAASHRAIAAASGERLEPGFADATGEELDAALHLAALAHAEPPVSAERRAGFLEAVATQIEAIGDTLIERAIVETGLPQARLLGERGRTTGQLRMFAALVREGSWVGARIDRALPDRKPQPRPQLSRMLVPIGPVAIFGASNFPLAFSVAGGDTASALGAGCPVVVKAHPSHPGTSELVGEAIVAAVRASGLHPGSFALVHGHSHVVGQQLVSHPLTRAVAFTGSLRGGRALIDAAATRACPIPVFAEMGSVNPVFVLPAALAHAGLSGHGSALALAAAGSLTLGVGQFCTNPGVILVPEGEAGDHFVAALAAALADVEPGVMLSPAILASYRAGLSRRATVEGIERLNAAAESTARAHAQLFTIDAARFMARPELQDELFGPAGLVVRWRDAEQLVQLAGSFEGQLSATIHVDETDEADLALAARLIPPLRDRVGRLLFNGFPTGVEVSPAMQHGGPWPASSDARTSSVGTAAIERFARPVCFQDLPDALLPPELQAGNPGSILRWIDGEPSREPL